MIKKSLFLVLCFFFSIASSNAFSKSKVKALNYTSVESKLGQITIDLKGALTETPELLVKDNMIQISVPNSFVWPKIEKKVSVKNSFDTTVLAYQFNKEVVRVRTMLPYTLAGKEALVNVTLRDKKIIINFPKKGNVTALSPAKSKKNTAVSQTTNYDETYLEKLLKDKATMKKEYGSELALTDTTLSPSKEDKVSMALSAQDKNEPKAAKGSFSVMSYIGKFVAFLGLVLLLFYGVVALMRKGVMKKGKLGFLNNTKMVEVLSTTYIAPKRSVMMIRAHNQVFLVGSSDSGLQPLGEINDVNGLLKDGEKQVSGNNFDSSLFDAGKEEKEFKLKEMTQAPADDDMGGSGGLAALLAKNEVEEKVKFSDQIKKKVKNLKSFQ